MFVLNVIVDRVRTASGSDRIKEETASFDQTFVLDPVATARGSDTTSRAV